MGFTRPVSNLSVRLRQNLNTCIGKARVRSSSTARQAVCVKCSPRRGPGIEPGPRPRLTVGAFLWETVAIEGAGGFRGDCRCGYGGKNCCKCNDTHGDCPLLVIRVPE